MRPDLIEGALGGLGSPIAVLVLAAVVSFAGAYLGGYLGERGRNRATREDFEEIKRRLKESSEISSRVEGTVSRGLWVEQQRWEFRRNVYLKLIEYLAAARAALREVYELELEDPARHDLPEIKKEARLKELFSESQRLQDAVRKEFDLRGRLFLSSPALKAIERYLEAESLRVMALEREMSDSDPGKAWRIHSWQEHLESEVKAAAKAYDEVMAAAKADLLLDRELVPGA